MRVMSKVSGVFVEADTAAVNAYPHISFPVFEDGVYRIVANAGGVNLIVYNGAELPGAEVEDTQAAVFRSDPKPAFGAFANAFDIVVPKGTGVSRIISELLESTLVNTFKKVEPCSNSTYPEPMPAVFKQGGYLIARKGVSVAVGYKSFKSIGLPVKQVQASVGARPDVVLAIAEYSIHHAVAQTVIFSRIVRKVYSGFFFRIKKI